MPQIQINKKYKFRIQVGNKLLNYTGIVTEITTNFISFKDKFGDIINYNLKNVISFTEVSK